MKIVFQNINQMYSVNTPKVTPKHNYYAVNHSVTPMKSDVQAKYQVSFKSVLKRIFKQKTVQTKPNISGITETMKNYFPKEQVETLISVCKGGQSEKIVQTCLNELENLAKLGFNYEQIYDIIDYFLYNNSQTGNDVEFKITENIPNYLIKENDLDLTKRFIDSRITASSVKDKFNRERYDLFNALSKQINCRVDIRNCSDLISRIFNHGDKKDLKNILEVAEKKGLSTAIDYTNVLSSQRPFAKKLIDKTDITYPHKVIEQFEEHEILSKTSIDRFIELYNINKAEDFNLLEPILIRFIQSCYKGDKFQPKIFEFIKENLKFYKLHNMLEVIKTDDKTGIDRAKFEVAKKLYYDLDLKEHQVDQIFVTDLWKDENLIEKVEKTKEYFTYFGTSVLIDSHVENYPIENILNLRDKLFKIVQDLKESSPEQTSGIYSKGHVEEFLFRSTRRTIRMLRILGEDIFLKLVKERFDELPKIEKLFISLPNEIQLLIDKLHPEKSERYQQIDQEIRSLKNGFKKGGDNSEIIKKLKDLGAEKRSMLDSRLKDPKDFLMAVSLYKFFYNNNKKILDDIMPYLCSAKEEDREQLRSIIEKYLFETLGINIKNKELKKHFHFADSKYLFKLIQANSGFIESVQDVVKVLEQNYRLNISTALNSLPANIKTRKAFEKNGLNYDKWISPLSDLTVKTKTTISANKIIHNSIKALEEEFNGQEFAMTFSPNARENFEKFLSQKGFSLRRVKVLTYDNAGFFSGAADKLKIFKNNKEININEALEFVKLFEEYTTKKEFWSDVQSYREDYAKTLIDHILKRRLPEIERATDNLYKAKQSEITISKVDMNDIKKALFLGDDAGCCTATDGVNSWTVGPYILNKCIQAIEIKKGDTSLGNTMCFVANVNGKLSLILDNIEVKSELQFSEDVKKSIIEFAHKLCAELGNPNMDIYAGTNRHLLDFSNYPVVKNATIKIVGEAEDLIYIDCLDGEENIKPNLFKYADLIKITD